MSVKDKGYKYSYCNCGYSNLRGCAKLVNLFTHFETSIIHSFLFGDMVTLIYRVVRTLTDRLAANSQYEWKLYSWNGYLIPSNIKLFSFASHTFLRMETLFSVTPLCINYCFQAE